MPVPLKGSKLDLSVNKTRGLAWNQRPELSEGYRENLILRADEKYAGPANRRKILPGRGGSI